MNNQKNHDSEEIIRNHAQNMRNLWHELIDNDEDQDEVSKYMYDRLLNIAQALRGHEQVEQEKMEELKEFPNLKFGTLLELKRCRDVNLDLICNHDDCKNEIAHLSLMADVLKRKVKSREELEDAVRSVYQMMRYPSNYEACPCTLSVDMIATMIVNMPMQRVFVVLEDAGLCDIIPCWIDLPVDAVAKNVAGFIFDQCSSFDSSYDDEKVHRLITALLFVYVNLDCARDDD